MPAYNCEKFVDQAITSMLGQTYSNFELLIADDCSKDQTKQKIDAYTDTRIKRFHNEVNLGYLKASNKLFKQCSGELITFQDADDYSDPARLEKLVSFLDEHKDIAVVGSNVKKVDENGAERPQTNFPLSHTDIVNNFENYRIVFTGSALMLRKEVVEKYGIYNEYFDRIGSEDTYWYSHIINGSKVANLEEALYYYRINSNSVTSTHRNPKAFVGHDLIISMHKRRAFGKKDYIASGEWSNADICAKFLMLVNDKKENKPGTFMKFLLLSMKHPMISSGFARQFLSQKAG